MLARRAVLALGAVALLVPAVPAHAKATLVKRSAGTVVATRSYYSIEGISFELTGLISFGNRTFQGTASGGVWWWCCGGTGEPPIPLHGSSPAGDLDASCVDHVGLYDATPTAGDLMCTGHIGDGTTATTRLVIALPVASGAQDQYHGTDYEYSGAFAG